MLRGELNSLRSNPSWLAIGDINDVVAQWEYYVSHVETLREGQGTSPHHQRLIEHMNQMDAAGWELVNGAESVSVGDNGRYATLFWRTRRKDATAG